MLSKLKKCSITVIFQNNVGFDTEFTLKDERKNLNRILSRQIAIKTRMVLKITNITDFEMGYMHPQTSKITTKIKGGIFDLLLNLIRSRVENIRLKLYKSSDEYIRKLIEKLDSMRVTQEKIDPEKIDHQELKNSDQIKLNPGQKDPVKNVPEQEKMDPVIFVPGQVKFDPVQETLVVQDKIDPVQEIKLEKDEDSTENSTENSGELHPLEEPNSVEYSNNEEEEEEEEIDVGENTTDNTIDNKGNYPENDEEE